jgi:DoxX-like family
LAAGLIKLSQPRQQLATTMGWVEDFSDPGVRAIGALEILGALGLLVLAVTGVATVLIPIAAIGLALLMVGAAATHRRRGELPMIGINAVLLVLALVVAWARFGPYSL